jgi:SPP1 family phage portal protein
MREREVAELWYFELDSKGKPQNIRMKILRPSEGNKLYPHFDDWGNMDGFARKFKTRDENGDTTTHFDIYTRELVYRLIENGGDYVQQHQPARHGFTKVPVIYYRQEHAEWHDVQIAIERVEELLSNWGDTNDYFGTPAYFFKGKLKGFAEKGEQGKVYQGEGDCDMRVLSWDNSPESVRNELATLLNIIYSFSQIPDISFETMKQLGNNTSGVAIQLMFTDPHMHAENKIQMYGEMFQRRYNLVQNGIATSITTISDREVAEIEVEPKFEPYMPKNLLETIQLLNLSTGNKPTMSQQEAVKQNPLVDNAAEVQQQLDSEAQAQQTASMLQDLYGIANS